MQRPLAVGCAALLLLGVSLGAGSCKPRQSATHAPSPEDRRDTRQPTTIVRAPDAPPGGTPSTERLRERIYRLPMLFETNKGHAPKSARFVAHHPTHTLLVMDDAIELRGTRPDGRADGTRRDHTAPGTGHATPIRLAFGGRGGRATPVAETPLKASANHYPAGPASDAVLDIPLAEAVRFPKLYPDIDLVIRGTRGHANLSYFVGPDGDTTRIRLQTPKDALARIDADGTLRVRTVSNRADNPNASEWTLSPPVAYACDAAFEPRRSLGAHYVTLGDNEFGIRVSGRLAGECVLIDPDIGYATWLGSEGIDFVGTNGLALGGSGRVFVAERQYGSAFNGQPDFDRTMIRAIDFTDPDDPQILYQTSFDHVTSLALAPGGGADVLFSGAIHGNSFPIVGSTYLTSTGVAMNSNGVIGLLNASGILARSTYLASWGDSGPSGQYIPTSIALDTSGAAPRVWVAGVAWGFGYHPANVFTHGPSTLSPRPYGGGGASDDNDAFVVALTTDLTTVDAFTFLGGAGFDGAEDIALLSGRVLVSGWTESTDFPVTPGAAQSALSAGPGFIGSPQPGAPSRDGFITELDQNAVIVRSTFHGGSRFEQMGSLAVDPLGRPCVAMRTGSDYDTGVSGIVSRFSADFSSVVSNTIIGGDDWDEALGIDVDASGRIHAAGWTTSDGLDTTTAIDDTRVRDEGWMAQLTPAGGIAYLTYIGGSFTERVSSIALGAPDRIFVLGITGSTDFPGPSTLRAEHQGSLDGFLALYTQALPPEADFLAVVDAPAVINLNEIATLTITVRNPTASVLTGATLEAVLPTGLTHMFSTPIPTVAGSTLTWAVPALAPGHSATFTAVARGIEAGVQTTDVRLLSAGGPIDDEDEQTTVLPDPVPALTLTKTGPPLVPRGGAGVYTLRVRNVGTTDAVALEITDTIDQPKLTEIIAATETVVPGGLSNSSVTFTESEAEWSIGLLEPGDERELLVIVQFAPDNAEIVTNGARLSSPTYPNLVLNTFVQTQIEPISADLRVTLLPMETSSPGPGFYKRFPMRVEELTGTAEDMGIINLVVTFDMPGGGPTGSNIDLSAAGAIPSSARHIVGTPMSYKGAINLPRTSTAAGDEVYLPRTVTLVFHEDLAVTNIRVEVSSDLVQDTNQANNVATGP